MSTLPHHFSNSEKLLGVELGRCAVSQSALPALCYLRVFFIAAIAQLDKIAVCTLYINHQIVRKFGSEVQGCLLADSCVSCQIVLSSCFQGRMMISGMTLTDDSILYMRTTSYRVRIILKVELTSSQSLLHLAFTLKVELQQLPQQANL